MVIVGVGCWKEGRCPALEPARLRGLSITNKRVEASLAGGPRTLNNGTRTLESTRAELLLMGPSRWNVNRYAACGCAVVQMDLNGDMTPWCGVGVFMSISLEAQRTIKRVDIWAFLSPCVSCAGHYIFSVLQEERCKLSKRARWIAFVLGNV